MAESPYRIGGGRYEIRSLIGRGGMAEVHQAYDTLLSRVVAIKMLRIDLAKDTVFLTRFRREALASASLNHENIVQVYDTGEQVVTAPDGTEVHVPYIVMELVEGHTVHQLLTDGQPVPINEAIEIMSGVLNALEYSHKRGLVHRDIKPGNVMLTNSGKIKVMDFGIARALEDSGQTMTSTDAVVGTAQYLSPEQARGETVDTRSDLYSCGCMLFELLTGRAPFKGDSAVSVAYQHVAEMPPLPSSIAADISPELDRMVMKSLAKRPEDRYQDAAAMRSDMVRAAAGAAISAPELPPLPVSTPTEGFVAPQTSYAPAQWSQVMEENPDAEDEDEAARKKKKKVIWAVVIGILVAIALIAVVWWLIASNRAQEPQQVAIPENIIGMSAIEAQRTLEGLGLNMEQGQAIASDTVDKGKVAATDPKPGTKVDTGSTVTIQLSSGAAEITVPDVSGQTQDAARKALEDAGLRVGSVKYEDDSKVAADRVIRTTPEAGSSASKDEEVILVLSSGYVSIDSGQVVGKSQEQGLKYLADLGLQTNTVTEETTAVPNGQIVSVEPSGRVKVGSSVTVKVAKTPPAPAPASPSAPSGGNNSSSDPSPSASTP
ncbi:Stk1 family PASTA domain-containing Ser/Thr kinase [Varibaculum cambriense]|uniref:Stk1 family PASTA domain-containing Ser/Thr kinase n=1 Tax=Varibaculum cambriense TaxID=184870 RepID=UPI0003B788B3|nr:Stk1 family PASTA domain-containing Ser/Thr kinase [Varibaculum cambriense]MDU7407068.1 Stk1 family PASTA domain-containing Ser/Thr kinase [Varibaculum cambriense]